MIEIKRLDTGAVIHTSKKATIGEAIKEGVQNGCSFYRANLRYANLSSTNLSYANLSSADLRYANLSSANLSSTNLSYANLSSADLRYANLSFADLRSANLRYANLSSTNLSFADLRSANLRYANLSSAIGSELALAKTRILPEGDLIGWKKCNFGVIVKLRIPANAKRSHAFGRKCRAEFVDVLEVFGQEYGLSLHDGTTKYAVGARVTCHAWEEDWTKESGGGIHFYLTRIEAENHN